MIDSQPDAKKVAASVVGGQMNECSKQQFRDERLTGEYICYNPISK